jgi:hypothetical protein
MTIGLPSSPLSSPRELSAHRIEGRNAPVAEVAHEQRVAERSKVRRRECDAPRRLQVIAEGHAAEEMAARVKHVDEPAPSSVSSSGSLWFCCAYRTYSLPPRF